MHTGLGSRRPSLPLLGIIVLAVVGLLIGDRRAPRAAGTDPTLFLTSVEAFATASGARTVTVDGTFSFDDLVQFSFPAGLLVLQGDRFVRFDFSGTVSAGNSPLVVNGVTAPEIPTLLGSGTPAAAPAALLNVQPDRIMATLPPGFSPGAASVLVFTVIGGDAFVSNTLAVTLP